MAECHRNGALAVEAVERRRQQAAEAVREESKALEAERRRALAEEEERRQEVIREIRALELVPRKREAVIDPTYEPGHGLLEEMSLAELRERLAIVAAREAEATQLRRQDIIRTKQQAQEALAGKVGAIAAYRKLGAAQAADERARAAKAKAEREAADRLRREDAALQLESAREALRAKGRAAEAELAAELKRIKVKSQFLGKDTAAVEAAKYGSLERGAGREAAERQRGGQASALRQVQLKDKEVSRRRETLACTDRSGCAGRPRAACRPRRPRLCALSRGRSPAHRRRPRHPLPREQRAQRSLLQVADAKARVDWAASQALRFQNSAFDATLTDRQAAEQKQLVAAAARESHERSRAAYADAFPFTHGAGAREMMCRAGRACARHASRAYTSPVVLVAPALPPRACPRSRSRAAQPSTRSARRRCSRRGSRQRAPAGRAGAACPPRPQAAPARPRAARAWAARRGSRWPALRARWHWTARQAADICCDEDKCAALVSLPN